MKIKPLSISRNYSLWCALFIHSERVWTGRTGKIHPRILRGHSLYIIVNKQVTVASIDLCI